LRGGKRLSTQKKKTMWVLGGGVGGRGEGREGLGGGGGKQREGGGGGRGGGGGGGGGEKGDGTKRVKERGKRKLKIIGKTAEPRRRESGKGGGKRQGKR